MSDESVLRVRSVSLKRRSDQVVVLWGATEKEIPRRPDSPGDYPYTDARHWYDREYAGWGVTKVNIPESPRDGARGKKVIYLQPGDGFGYLDRYVSTISRLADESGIELEIKDAVWDKERFRQNVLEAISERPDLILLNPEHDTASTEWYRWINEAGIPVIGSNFLANRESHQYLVAWTGPDDWGQSRILARYLADSMDRSGSYGILQHLEGNSSYYARTWGVISELKVYAPKMNLIGTAPGMIPDKAAEAVGRWIDEYGENLKGLFCADDNESMKAVARVLENRDRRDISCVAAGSSRTGIELVIDGRLLATAYQSPEIDGEIAMQTAIDWFEGVPLEPIRYLPKHIITERDAADFLDLEPQVDTLDLERLYRCVREFDWQGTYHFYGDLYLKLIETRMITEEHFQGLCLEILSELINIVRNEGLSTEECLGSYDGMVKHLFRDKDVSSVLDWLNHLSQDVISRRMEKLNRRTPIQEIIDYIDDNISEPLSLKTLSHSFDISHAYLGQMFRKETGVKFNDYLNSKRVEKAKVMLKGEAVTINAVARDLGYTNPDYFYKIFRKLTGQSAGDYIRSLK